MGLDMQIIKPPPPQCYYAVPLEIAVQSAQMVNDGVAEFVARKPDRARLQPTELQGSARRGERNARGKRQHKQHKQGPSHLVEATRSAALETVSHRRFTASRERKPINARWGGRASVAA